MTYQSTKSLLHYLIFGYIAVALILGFNYYHREIFPIFSWSLFSEVPSTQMDFAVRVTAIDGAAIEPRDFMDMGELFSGTGSTRAYYTIQDLGGALMRRDLATAESLRRLFETHYMALSGRTVRYELIIRRFDPIERWHTGQYELVKMADFELGGTPQ